MLLSNQQWLENYFVNAEAIIFDFDDTIVDEAFSIQKRWSIVLDKYENILNINNLKDCFFIIYENTGASYKFHIDDALSKLNIDKSFKNRILQDFLSQKSQEEFIFPSALKILQLLHSKRFKLALFTNGLKKVQKKRIELVKIQHFFDHIQYGDCSSKKPNTASFQFLSKSLKISIDKNFIMIGNSIDEDYIGATSFGATCILVNCTTNQTFNSPCYQSIDDLYKDLMEIF